MENNTLEENTNQYTIEKVSPLRVLGILLVIVLGGFLVANIITAVIGLVNGWDLTQGLPALTDESTAADRNQFRFLLMLSHLFLFVTPALLTAYLLYKSKWIKELFLDQTPKSLNVVLGVILLLCAMPLVQYTYWLNQQLPLPEWMIGLESDTNEMLQQLLIADSNFELFFNLLIVAIIPGIGEELVFRGLVQRSFARLTSNPHLGIWIAAFIFSFIHFQFQGFIPRVLLGAILGYLFYWTGNLWVPIIAHFFNNASQLIAQHLFNKEVSDFDLESLETVPITAAIISLALVFGIGYFMHQRNKGHYLDQVSTPSV